MIIMSKFSIMILIQHINALAFLQYLSLVHVPSAPLTIVLYLIDLFCDHSFSLIWLWKINARLEYVCVHLQQYSMVVELRLKIYTHIQKHIWHS